MVTWTMPCGSSQNLREAVLGEKAQVVSLPFPALSSFAQERMLWGVTQSHLSSIMF